MIKKILLSLIISSQALAGLPPTSTKGSGDTNPVTTFQLNFPNIPLTHSGTAATLGTIPILGGGTGQTTKSGAFDALSPNSTKGDTVVFNGTTNTNLPAGGNGQVPIYDSTQTIGIGYSNHSNKNLLVNPSFEYATAGTSWNGPGVTISANTSTFTDGKQSGSISPAGASGNLIDQQVTLTNDLSTTNLEFTIWVKTSVSGIQVCATENSSVVGTCANVSTSNTWAPYTLNFPGLAATNVVGIRLYAPSSVTGTVLFDDAYVGAARNTGVNANPNVFTALVSGAGTVSAQTGNPSTWISGNASIASTSNFTLTLVSGIFTSAPNCNVNAVDTTTTVPANAKFISVSSSSIVVNTFYDTTGSNYVAQPYSFYISCTKTGTDYVQTSVNANAIKAPTVQRFISGSGTYTTPTGVTQIRVRMVGGGGGGGGTGDSNTGGNGGNGGDTTFGSSLLTAGGGVGGQSGSGSSAGGSGGTVTVNSPAIDENSHGGNAGAGNVRGSSINFVGGIGAGSALGGSAGSPAVSAGAYSAGLNGVANSGAGGSGASNGKNTTNNGTGGGGSGGYVEAIIVNPSSPYPYIVGASGSAGSAGTSGSAGGAGGTGYIEVTEYYGFNAPIVIGGYTSNSTNTSFRHEYGSFGGSTVNNSNCAASSTCTVWQDSAGGTTVTSSAAPVYTVTFAKAFGSIPNCICNCVTYGVSARACYHDLSAATTTTATFGCWMIGSSPALAAGGVTYMCDGAK